MKITFTISGDSKAKWDVNPTVHELTKMVENGAMSGPLIWSIALIEVLTKLDAVRDMPVKKVEELENKERRSVLSVLSGKKE